MPCELSHSPDCVYLTCHATIVFFFRGGGAETWKRRLTGPYVPYHLVLRFPLHVVHIHQKLFFSYVITSLAERERKGNHRH